MGTTRKTNNPDSPDVSERAVDIAPAGGLTSVARSELNPDAPRAETRGAYRTPDGRRRIVGAGQPVPDGWRRIEDASLSARAETIADAEDKAERGPRN